MDAVKERSIDINKTIVFVNSIDKCHQIYSLFYLKLKKGFFKNGAKSISNRLIDMYHSGTDEKSKARISSEFGKTDSTLRILICTIAFGLGVNIPDVRNVVLWGLPSSILDLWQEIGRGGRDSKQSQCIIYGYPRSLVCKTCTKKCDCKEGIILKQIMEETCTRYCILEYFVLNKEMEDELKTVVPTAKCQSLDCKEICQCEFCMCCSFCAKDCPCPQKNCSVNITEWI